MLNAHELQHTFNTVEPVMNPKAYTPMRGCRMRTHSRNDLAVSLSGLIAADTCTSKYTRVLVSQVHRSNCLTRKNEQSILSRICWRTCFAAE